MELGSGRAGRSVVSKACLSHPFLFALTGVVIVQWLCRLRFVSPEVPLPSFPHLLIH